MSYLTRLIILLLLLPLSMQAQTIQRVSIKGCKKTKMGHLQRFLCVKPGQELDTIRLKQDEQILRNLDIFSAVTPSIRDTVGGCIVEYELKERVTLLPIGKLGGTEDGIILQLGLIDYNFMGNGTTASAYYRYYDRHTFHAYMKTPYLKQSKWGLSGSILKQSTLEPIKFDIQDLRYKYDLWAFEALTRYEFAFRNFIEFGGAYLFEKYKPEMPEEVISPQAISLNAHKFLLKTLHTYERVNYFNEYRDGISNVVCFETVTSPETDGPLFWKLKNTSSYYKRTGKRGNLALRLNLGIAANAYTPFPPFVLDNYINVRGVGDRVLRGSREVSLNAEYRYTVFEHKIGAIQLVPFIDFGALGLSGQPLSSITEKENQAIFSGLGLRISARQFYNMIVRVDVSTNLKNTENIGLGFGIGQFF